MRPCKDCRAAGIGGRPAPHPGPRCATHHREAVKARREAAAARLRQVRYQLTAQDYAALHVAQGGVCAICRRATGRTRALSVDHDHAAEAAGGVRASVRGLLCRPCNDLLGHVRDDPTVLLRAAGYLTDPPARRVLTHRTDDPEETP